MDVVTRHAAHGGGHAVLHLARGLGDGVAIAHHQVDVDDDLAVLDLGAHAAQAEYIRSIVSGVAEHAPELDGYIAKYAKGWSFDRIPLVASAIMRVAMYESLYRSDIPTRVAVNEAVEIAKKYETPETVKFINGILGSFVRGEISVE